MPPVARSVGAVVLGFVLIGALAVGTDAMMITTVLPGMYDASGATRSVPLLLFTQLYVGAFATFGCWLAARLAPSRPMRHAIALGLLGLAFNAMGTAARWEQAPVWYHALALALVMPYAWLGGWLRERQLERRGAPAVAVA